MKTKFGMIGIFVEDIGTMSAFYRDALGLACDWDGESSYVEFQHEGIRFSMYERRALLQLLGLTPEFPKTINATFELAINVGEPENVDLKFQELLLYGAREIYAPRDEPWKMRSAMIADPEGNLIEIASDYWD